MELNLKSYYLTQDGVNGCDGQNTSGRNINIPTNSFVQKYATSVDIHLKKIAINDKPSLQIFQRMNHRTTLSWFKKKAKGRLCCMRELRNRKRISLTSSAIVGSICRCAWFKEVSKGLPMKDCLMFKNEQQLSLRSNENTYSGCFEQHTGKPRPDWSPLYPLEI